MAMHFDMYFFHKTSFYGAILVLHRNQREGGVGYYYHERKSSLRRSTGPTLFELQGVGAVNFPEKKCYIGPIYLFLYLYAVYGPGQ